MKTWKRGLMCVIGMAALAGAALGGTGREGQEGLFEAPFCLKADGAVIDTGKEWGHSAPCFEDLDGDGMADLIVGDFSGMFQAYKNVGTAKMPEFKSMGRIKAGGEDARVWIYCCIGGQARFCDLDGDGIRDMISNSYDPGHCYVFRGAAGGKFAAREELKDKNGVPMRSMPEQKQRYQSFGSFFAPVDWDGDGDLDMLVGCFGGELKVRMNEGTAKKAEFAAENAAVLADGKPMKVKAHFCPVAVDWDRDGLWDIIAGSDDGSVTWFRNIGEKSKPVFAAGQMLVQKHEGNGYNVVAWDKKPAPGIRTQVDVFDYNGDGKLDLIVGDFYTAYDFKDDLSQEQKNEVTALMADQDKGVKAYVAKMDAMRADFTKRFPGDEVYSEKAEKEWSEAYKTLRESPEAKEMEECDKEFAKKMRPFVAQVQGSGERAYQMARAHGHVWVYVRK